MFTLAWRDHLLAKRVVLLLVADFVVHIPFPAGQQVFLRCDFIGHEKAQVQAFERIEAEIQFARIEQTPRLCKQSRRSGAPRGDRPVNESGEDLLRCAGAQILFGGLGEVLNDQHCRQFRVAQAGQCRVTLGLQQRRTRIMGDGQKYRGGQIKMFRVHTTSPPGL